jgi:aminopeptidase-like protein
LTKVYLNHSEVFDYILFSLWLCNHSLCTGSSTGELTVLCVAHGLLELKSFKNSFTTAAVGAVDIYVTGNWFVRLDVHCT